MYFSIKTISLVKKYHPCQLRDTIDIFANANNKPSINQKRRAVFRRKRRSTPTARVPISTKSKIFDVVKA